MKKMNVLGQKTEAIRGKINRPNLLLHNVFFLMIILIIPEMNIIDFSSLIGEGGGLWQKWDFIRRSWVGGGVVSVLDVQSSSFLIKQNWICAVTTHHAEPNMNILLASNLPYESDVRQWSPPLVIPLHCELNRTIERTGQFECDVTWFFCFCFGFVRSHLWCGCCSIVCLHFQVLQIKKVDCKMSTKNMNNYK